MYELAETLPQHWEEKTRAQRQRSLVLAVNREDAAACTALLEAGADPNIQDATGSTVLHAAARQLSVEVAQLLLRYGASRKLQDKEGIHVPCASAAPWYWSGW